MKVCWEEGALRTVANHFLLSALSVSPLTSVDSKKVWKFLSWAGRYLSDVHSTAGSLIPNETTQKVSDLSCVCILNY